MTLFSLFLHRLRWMNLPGAMLVALLQRTPVLRLVPVAEEMVARSPFGAVVRAAATTLASLGAVHALAGATQFVINPNRNPETGTVGTTLTLAFTVTGAQTPAGSYQLTGTLPPGLVLLGANSSGVLNAASGVISGVPTTAGTFTISLLAYLFSNTVGDSWPPAPFVLTFAITGGAAVAPTITTQPASQTANAGASVAFGVGASGAPAPTYQWRKNGVDISGATNAFLTFTNVQLTDAGAYSVQLSNLAGVVTSNPAVLTVNASGAEIGRLINLSIRATVTAADPFFTVGVVIGGGGTSGNKALLIRAVGPSLAPFGVTDAAADSKLDVFAGSTVILLNDNWGGDPQLTSVGNSVGAFAITNTGSRDAMLLVPLVPGNYTAQVTGVGAVGGIALVEVYEVP